MHTVVSAVSDLCGFLRKASEFCINFCFNINGHFINNNAYGFFVIFAVFFTAAVSYVGACISFGVVHICTYHGIVFVV